MLSSRLSLSNLIELCRVLRHYLGSGLTLVDVFRQQAQRGPAAVRGPAGRIAAALEQGGSLEDALKREQGAFPPLFLSLSAVGERTGMLPEVCQELERYFSRQRQLRRQFLAMSAWPAIQFVLAVIVLTLMIFFLGMIASTMGTKPFDPLGLGLTGTAGALTFFGIIVGSVAGLIGFYVFVTRVLARAAAVDRILLSLPVLGPCLQALALGRFCLALRLTTESGMSIGKAVRLSLRATGHNAYAGASPIAESSIRDGDDLTLALTRTRMFNDEFLRILHVAEESGRLTDVLRHQGDHYYEEASRRLAILTFAASCGIWLTVAGFIILAVFRIFGSYLRLLDSLM